MNDMMKNLVERRKMLEGIIKEKQKKIRINDELNSNKESVYAIRHGRGYQYYKNNDKGLKYIKSGEMKWVEKNVQSEYDSKLFRKADKECKILTNLINLYNKGSIEEVYHSMPEGKRRLVVPDAITDEEFLEEWKKQPYEPLGFREDSPEYYSSRGEQMRSKSEVIIASLLDNMKVDYKYEKPLKLKNIGIVHPDFTILNCVERKEIYWEHFGMLDNEDYRNNAIRKIRNYEQTGYFLGDRLIVTEETVNCSLDIKSVERRVRAILGI